MLSVVVFAAVVRRAVDAPGDVSPVAMVELSDSEAHRHIQVGLLIKAGSTTESSTVASGLFVLFVLLFCRSSDGELPARRTDRA